MDDPSPNTPRQPGAAASARHTISGNNLFRIFAITTTANVLIDNLTLDGGFIGGSGYGGDIYNAGTLVIRNSVVSHGAALVGGGIYNAPGGHLTLIDTQVTSNQAVVRGAGIFADAGSQTTVQFTGPVNNVCICSNTANDGGGIFNLGLLSIAPGTQFMQNTASNFGGALANFSGSATIPALAASAGQAPAASPGPSLVSAALSPTLFISNSAGISGGAIYNSANLSLANAVILSNTSGFDGGGIKSFTGTLQIANAFIAYNTSQNGGGIDSDWVMTATAIAVVSNTATLHGGGLNLSFGSADVSDSTFLSNTSPLGGGIHVTSGKLRLDSSTVSANQASDGGGGLYQDSTAATNIANSTFSANSSPFLGDGGLSNSGMLTITSSTIVSNSSLLGAGNLRTISSGGRTWLQSSLVAFGAPINCTGTITSTGHNLDSADTCHLHATGDFTSTNPLIGPLADNGGAPAGTGATGFPFDGRAPRTHALLGGSPAIDHADQANCPAADERGAARPAGACDIGAYEFGVKIGQAITFTLPTLLIISQSPYPLGGTASSGLTVTYTVSGAPCSLAGANLILNSTGPCTVTAHQSGDSNYNATPDVARGTTVGVPLFLPLVRT